jgi:hypothetical protein
MHDVSTLARRKSVSSFAEGAFVAPENAVLYSAASEVGCPPEKSQRGSQKPNNDDV